MKMKDHEKYISYEFGTEGFSMRKIKSIELRSTFLLRRSPSKVMGDHAKQRNIL